MKIEVETIDQLIQFDHTVETYCWKCKRFGPDLDLKKYAAKGLGGKRPKDLKLKHRKCRTVLLLTIRPPNGYGKQKSATWFTHLA